MPQADLPMQYAVDARVFDLVVKDWPPEQTLSGEIRHPQILLVLDPSSRHVLASALRCTRHRDVSFVSNRNQEKAL